MAKRKAAVQTEAADGEGKRQKGKRQPKDAPQQHAAAEEGPSTSGAVVAASGSAVRNKEKVLVLSSRGITYR